MKAVQPSITSKAVSGSPLTGTNQATFSGDYALSKT